MRVKVQAGNIFICFEILGPDMADNADRLQDMSAQ